MYTYDNKEYPLQSLSYQVIGIGMEIHRLLGKGFLEIVYKDAFEYKLQCRGILYKEKKNIPLPIKTSYYHINFLLILLLITVLF